MIFARRRTVLLGDQAVSSAISLAVSVAAAQTSTPSEFGFFALLSTSSVFLLSFSRALTQEPMLFQSSNLDDASQEVRSAGAASLSVGVLIGLLLVTSSMFVNDARYIQFLLLFAIFIPVYLCQDHLRYRAFLADRPGQALLVDCIWLFTFLVGFLISWLLGTASLTMTLSIWVISACLSLVPFVHYLRTLLIPDLPGVRQVLRSRAGWATVLEWFATNLVSVLLPIILSVGISLAAAGSVRGAQTLLGFVQILYSTAAVMMQRDGRKSVLEGRPIFRLQVKLFGALAVLTALNLGLALLVPTSIGERILGETWDGAVYAMSGVAALQVTNALILVIGGGLRVRGLIHRAAQARVVTTVLCVTAMLLGVLTGNVLVVLSLMAAATLIGAGLYFIAACAQEKSTRSGLTSGEGQGIEP